MGLFSDNVLNTGLGLFECSHTRSNANVVNFRSFYLWYFKFAYYIKSIK